MKHERKDNKRRTRARLVLGHIRDYALVFTEGLQQNLLHRRNFCIGSGAEALFYDSNATMTRHTRLKSPQVSPSSVDGEVKG